MVNTVLFVLLNLFQLSSMRRRRGPLGGQKPCYKRHRIGHPTTVEPLIVAPSMPQPSNDVVVHELLPELSEVSAEPEDEMSHYYRCKMAEVEQWKAVRSELQMAAFDTAMPITMTCQLCCRTAPLLVKCDDCGIGYFGCAECVVQDHILRPMHLLQMWKISVTNNIYTHVLSRLLYV